MTIPALADRDVATADAEATRALGAALAAVAEAGDLICLWGELGAGKTQLAKGFGRGLGARTEVSSPTFVLMAEHEARLPLFHVDLYRLADATDALAGGLIDERQADGVTLIEWPDRLGDALPASRLDVDIDGAGEETRTIRLRTADPRYARYLEAAG